MVTLPSVMKVFVSSTKEDLSAERDALCRRLAVDHDVVRMEDFGSRGEDALSTCLSELANCEIYVLLLGHRYGSISEVTHLSYTHSEYERARELGLPVLPYIRSDFDSALPTADDPLRLRDFRELVEEAHTVARPYFSDPAELSAQVARDIDTYRGRTPVRPRFGKVRRGISAAIPYGIGTARHHRLRLHPFTVVLVDAGVIEAEQYPAEQVRRIRHKISQIHAALDTIGANVLVFNEIDTPADADQIVQERAAQARRAAAAIVCLVDSASSVGAVQLFDGASGAVGVWYPKRVEAAVPRIPKATLRAYIDREINDCSLTLRVVGFIENLIDRHLVAHL
jgi:hypothetical protein